MSNKITDFNINDKVIIFLREQKGTKELSGTIAQINTGKCERIIVEISKNTFVSVYDLNNITLDKF